MSNCRRKRWKRVWAIDRANCPPRIAYHRHVEEVFPHWAAAMGQAPDSLRAASENAIRTRYQEAYVGHPCYEAHDRYSAVYQLALECATLFFSVEGETAVIRGYHWEPTGQPTDDFDGGGIFW